VILRELWLGWLGFSRYLFRCVGKIQNRRAYPRAPASHLIRVTSCDRLSNELCNLVDISEGGLKFIAHHKPQPGSRMQVQVNLSEANKNIFLTGRVVWAKPSSAYSYHVGVEFTDADSRGIESIRDYVAFSFMNTGALRG
jgi:Tfp pilus assembly protein PilZ